MQSSFYRRTLPKLIIALVALAVGVFLSRGADNASAFGSFNASSNQTPSVLTAGANADITTVLNIPLNDYNFSSVINGTPAAATVAPGPGNPGFNPAVHPALGEVMGTLSSTSTLGLTGNPCGSAVTPSFTFLNATTDITDTIDAVPQNKTNPGSGGTLDNMWSDNGASTTGPGAQAPWNAAWPGMDPGEDTDGLPAQVNEYPSYLNIIFDPDYPATPGANAVQPLARYAGATNVVGTSVVLDLVIFAPGQLAGAGFGANHPFSQTGSIGYTSIAVLQDPTAEAAHGSISDFCSPLGTTTVLYGMARANPCKGAAGPPSCDSQPEISNPAPGANTKARYANPPAGNHSWISQHQSLRDADGDGIENALDACALVADKYNPRSLTGSGSDSDGDGMPDECDPTPTTNNVDHDGDGWENSYDNCPTVANATQTDSEANVGTYASVAPFGGPRGDGIGDACDTSDDTTGTGLGDGYPELEEAREPLCANSANDDDKTGAGLVADDTVVNDGCAAMGAPETGANCTNNTDNDSDNYVNDGCPQVGTYSEAQFKIGTSATDRCGVGNEGNGVPSGAWPADLYSGGIPNSTDKVNATDLTSFLAPAKRLDTAPGQAGFSSRWDLNPGRGFSNNMINVTDMTALLAANPKGYPPMFGNLEDPFTATTKAFNGPTCTNVTASGISNGAFRTTTTTNTYTIS